MRDPNIPVGMGIPMGFNPQTGLPQGQGLPPAIQQNQVKYQPNLNDPALAGLPPAVAGQMAMQKLGPNPPSASAISGAKATATTDAATGLPNYFDPTWYVQNNPDVLKGFNSLKSKKKGLDWYGKFHYDNFGKPQGGRFLGPNDPAYLARQQAGLGSSTAPAPNATQLAAYGAMSPEDQVNLVNFLKGMGLA